MKKHSEIEQLLEIMAQLRNPKQGCEWDLKQSYQTIVPHTLEEAYEVADVIERRAWDELPAELGDLLFQIVFYCQLAKEEGRFDFGDVVLQLNEKLVSRHPHVFTDATTTGDEQANWEARKQQERQNREQNSVLDDIPVGFPSLSRAHKVQKRAASVGFDWDNLNDVADKVTEELNEVMEEVEAEKTSQARLEEEVGDLLFSVVNLSRHLKVNPEQALRLATNKFERRFRKVEKSVEADGQEMKLLSLEVLDEYWEQAKKH
ncbi:nucleoside triphosphate pyrophosphohydrolase [Parashewanella curva]|uniref:Nucleoside triphosphate pyrophosphohydrolase n=1 Tax=Parashewanella curva TaxID=2338552 RepID=A0A3L8PTC4_9GAMM|nr:nucleoside triphosphate pyrophosphohydrolase [Parashewanella curva]RLV58514.1 nucleoside triphosphate pyrophosphohydrolase [Parashewanella curva]